MGYTHYFYTKSTSQKRFDNYAETCKVLHNALPETLVIRGGDGTGTPLFGEDLVLFNGDYETEDDYETFALEHTTENDKFNFCKTARKPYDLFVCACLIAAKVQLNYTIGSDGGKDDWAEAIEFYNRVTDIGVAYEYIIKE